MSFLMRKNRHGSLGLSSVKRNNLIFYIVMISLPVLQFVIFYIGVNLNSVLLAFKQFDRLQNEFVFSGFSNLKKLFEEFATSFTLKNAMLNSLKVWFLCTFITLPIALLFSFYIYKKMLFEGLFKFVLFLPSIISGIVTVVIYTYFVERAVPAIWEKLFKTEMGGLLAESNTQFITVLFYNIFYSFGGYMLLFAGAMNTVDQSVKEAAALDGAYGFKEFIYIVLPKAYGTLSTFFVLSVAGIFSNQFALYSFYGIAAPTPVTTFGYYLYAVTSVATSAEYPRLAAMGIMLTVVIVPVTLGIKYALEKLGPKE